MKQVKIKRAPFFSRWYARSWLVMAVYLLGIVFFVHYPRSQAEALVSICLLLLTITLLTGLLDALFEWLAARELLPQQHGMSRETQLALRVVGCLSPICALTAGAISSDPSIVELEQFFLPALCVVWPACFFFTEPVEPEN